MTAQSKKFYERASGWISSDLVLQYITVAHFTFLFVGNWGSYTQVNSERDYTI